MFTTLPSLVTSPLQTLRRNRLSRLRSEGDVLGLRQSNSITTRRNNQANVSQYHLKPNENAPLNTPRHPPRLYYLTSLLLFPRRASDPYRFICTLVNLYLGCPTVSALPSLRIEARSQPCTVLSRRMFRKRQRWRWPLGQQLHRLFDLNPR